MEITFFRSCFLVKEMPMNMNDTSVWSDSISVDYLLRWARTETEDCLRRNISNTTDSVPSEI